MKKELSRGSFLKMSGGVVAGAYVLGLTGCGGDGDSEGAQLRMAWWGGQERHDRTLAAIDYIENNNSSIEIEAEYSGFDGYWDRMATQTAGGSAPDLIQMDYRYLSEYAGRGALLELRQFASATINLDDFDESIIESGTVDTELYAIALGVNSHALFYDVAVLEEIGVTMPDHTWNWDDFTELASAISDSTEEGYYGMEDGGENSDAFGIFVRQKGKEFYTENGRLGFDEGDLTEWWTYWDEQRKSGMAPPGEVTDITSGDIQDSPLIRGRSAMVFAFSNQLTDFQALAENELNVSMYPNNPEGSRPGQFVRPSMWMSGYADSDNPEEIATVIDSLVNDPEVNQRLETERGIPPSSEIREMLRPEVSEAEQKVFDYIDLVRENSSPYPPVVPQGAGEIDDLISRLNGDIAFGRTTINETVDRFFSEAERILA